MTLFTLIPGFFSIFFYLASWVTICLPVIPTLAEVGGQPGIAAQMREAVARARFWTWTWRAC